MSTIDTNLDDLIDQALAGGATPARDPLDDLIDSALGGQPAAEPSPFTFSGGMSPAPRLPAAAQQAMRDTGPVSFAGMGTGAPAQPVPGVAPQIVRNPDGSQSIAPQRTHPAVAAAMADQRQRATEEVAAQRGFFGTVADTAESAVADATQTMEAGWRNLAPIARGEANLMQYATGTMPRTVRPDQAGAITGAQGYTQADIEGMRDLAAAEAEKRPVAALAGSLAAMPVATFEPAGLAALAATHRPSAAVMESAAVQGALQGIRNRLGLGVSRVVEAELRGALEGAAFEGAHGAIQGEDLGGIAERAATGAIGGALFTAPAAAAGAVKAPVDARRIRHTERLEALDRTTAPWETGPQIPEGHRRARDKVQEADKTAEAQDFLREQMKPDTPPSPDAVPEGVKRQRTERLIEAQDAERQRYAQEAGIDQPEAKPMTRGEVGQELARIRRDRGLTPEQKQEQIGALMERVKREDAAAARPPQPEPEPLPELVSDAPEKPAAEIEAKPETPDKREPWQMTRGEYITKQNYPRPSSDMPGITDYHGQIHKAEVRAALKRGDPVPETVTESYPDLPRGVPRQPKQEPVAKFSAEPATKAEPVKVPDFSALKARYESRGGVVEQGEDGVAFVRPGGEAGSARTLRFAQNADGTWEMLSSKELADPRTMTAAELAGELKGYGLNAPRTRKGLVEAVREARLSPKPSAPPAAAKPAAKKPPLDATPSRAPEVSRKVDQPPKPVRQDANTETPGAPHTQEFTARAEVTAPPKSTEPERPVTSARKKAMDGDRKALGLDELDSPGRRSWEKALDDAAEQGIPENAARLAAEVNEKPRALSDIETAGLVVRASDLKTEHASLMEKVQKATEPAELASLSAEAGRVEQEFDALSRALYASGTEKGRALAAQKLTIDQDHSLVAVKSRAKAAKGKELSTAESKRLEELTSKLDDTQKRLAELETKVKEGTVERVITRHKAVNRGKPAAKHAAEEVDLLANLKRLLDAGCKT